MEHQGTYLHTPNSSSTSAIDLPHTPAVFTSSGPPSPSLEASDSRGSFARRRTSWGHRLVGEGRDPLQLDNFPSSNSATLSAGLNTSGSGPIRTGVDDLFPTLDDHNFPFSTRYGSSDGNNSSYVTSHAGPSSASLIRPREFEAEPEQREDDEAHLTANMSLNGTEERWEGDPSEDPEGNAATTPRTRRRTARYSVSPSPLKKTGTAIKYMTHNLRRASVRVVNLGSTGLEKQIRLGDGDEGTHDTSKFGESEEEPLPDLSKSLPIRGRALGFLGPESKVRLALFNLLVYSCVYSSFHPATF
jgi:voltage-dependent calcium channel